MGIVDWKAPTVAVKEDPQSGSYGTVRTITLQFSILIANDKAIKV